MEHIPSYYRRVEGEGEKAGAMESVSPKKSFQGRGGVLEPGVWFDGRIYGEEQDSF